MMSHAHTHMHMHKHAHAHDAKHSNISIHLFRSAHENGVKVSEDDVIKASFVKMPALEDHVQSNNSKMVVFDSIYSLE
jgi:hypothetical protein